MSILGPLLRTRLLTALLGPLLGPPGSLTPAVPAEPLSLGLLTESGDRIVAEV